MLTNFRRSAVALGATSLAALGLAACGGESIPGNAVVRVGDTAIKKDAYEHWLDVAALSQASQLDPEAAQSGKKPKVTIPEPPDFEACIAEKKKTAPKPAKGQPNQSDSQFETQCKQEYEGLRDQVLQFLISSQWIQGEASDRDVKVTDAEVKKQFETTKKQSFPKDEDFKKFLSSSGMTEADLLFRVRLDTLSNKLREAVVKGKDQVSDAQIKTYYDKNKARFAQPERRDLRIVLTKTEAQAKAAKAKLEGGASFSKVAKKSSIDQASKDQGGVLLAVAKGQQEKALDEAVFAAKKGKLSGPVKTQFGYYIFKVQKITKASQQSVKQSSDTIKQLLASQNQQEALDKFVEDFRKKWKGMTQCKDDFLTPDCDNAPEEDGATGPDGAGGGQPVDPNQQQQVPVDPSQGGGGQQVPIDPSTGQPVDPSGGGGQQVPVDPSQGGGGQQVPVDPSQGGGGQQVPIDPSTGQPVDPSGGGAPAAP